MTDEAAPDDPPRSRPRPQYGEYATPAEVAAARGIPLPDPRGESEAVARLGQPIPPTPTPRETHRRHAPPPSGRPVAARHPSPVNNMLTVLLLVFGIWNTVQSIPTFFDFGATISQGFELGGYGTASFGATAHVTGIVLLILSFLLMIAAVGFSLQRIRVGRTSFWIPLVAGAVWFLSLMVGLIVVVANTPGVLAVLQNHS